MKKTNFFPIERNNYFFGKLLTEQDFNGEQEYLNNKRRLINRYVHGMGVAAGMGVLMADDKTISVEPGFALDASGREIFVDAPCLRKLSMIDGYDRLTPDSRYVYLCIEYDEKGSGADISISDSSKTEFASMRETYRLFLTQEEPERYIAAGTGVFDSRALLYQGDGVTVIEEIPRLIYNDEEAEAKIIIKNGSGKKKLRLSMDQDLGLISHGGKNKFSMDETMELLEGECRAISVPFAISSLKEDTSSEIRFTELMIEIDSRRVVLQKPGAVPVLLRTNRQEHEREKLFLEGSFENITRDGLYSRLYLARVRLIHQADAYMIESVEQLPFEQYVLSNDLIKGCLEVLKERNPEPEKEDKKNASANLGQETSAVHNKAEAYGTFRMELGAGLKEGQCRYSDKIVHGLGTGAVDINLNVQEGDYVYSGDRSVFPAESSTVYTLCAKTDIKKGTFMIGLRAEQDTSDTAVTIHWSAKTFEQQREADRRRQIYIMPEHIELKVYESIVLHAESRNMHSDAVFWQVISPGGGSIDANGIYTAPASAGIYEIEAVSKEDTNVRNTAFIIVREQENDR